MSQNNKITYTNALNGLRGCLAFHVMAYHACWFENKKIPKFDLQANADMSMFFLLSGFCLAIKYGKNSTNRCSKTLSKSDESSMKELVHAEQQKRETEKFDHWKFYKKRLIRILPLHYLGMVLVLIVWRFGGVIESSAKIIPGLLFSVIPINTWLLPYFGGGFDPNPPSWTISTLMFWYLLFPSIIKRFERFSNKEIAGGIVKYYWLNIVLVALSYIYLGPFLKWNTWVVTQFTTMAHPVIRFPVFLMGILAGLQVSRANQSWESFEDPNIERSLLFTFLPCNFPGNICNEKTPVTEIPRPLPSREESRRIWRRRTDFNAIMYIVVLFAIILGNVALNQEQCFKKGNTLWEESDENRTEPNTRNNNFSISSKLQFGCNDYITKYWMAWGDLLQVFAVHSQLTIVIGLCMDGGTSILSKILQTRVMRLLGDMSLSLYLVHWSVLCLVILAQNNHQIEGPIGKIIGATYSGKVVLLPGTPLIIVIISLLVSFIISKYFEKPISKLLYVH